MIRLTPYQSSLRIIVRAISCDVSLLIIESSTKSEVAKPEHITGRNEGTRSLPILIRNPSLSLCEYCRLGYSALWGHQLQSVPFCLTAELVYVALLDNCDRCRHRRTLSFADLTTRSQ